MASLAGLLGPLHHFIQHRTLTRVQEDVLPIVLTTDENVVVAAPTGSGKTLVMEAAMLRLFATRLVQDSATLPPSLLSASSSSSSSVSGLHHLQQLKAVYVCPIKALAYEKCDTWRRMFSSLRVVLETGDHDRGRGEAESLDAVLAAHIIIATPERWDSITRRWREAAVLGLVNAVGLLLLDEIHTLREERGAALEAIVSRMKMIEASRGGAQHASTTTTTTTTWPRVRYMAVSATLPNVSDLATWLAVPPCGIFAFSARDRPVPLTLRVMSFANDSSRPYAFSRFLSYKLLHLIHQHGEGRPAMVFCPSRQDAALTAQQLSQDLQRAAHPSSLVPSAEVVALANRARDKQLRAHLLMGIAHHHAALTAEDRQLVEHMFREQYISILCTTTTLALGVNLPAHLVVVKGTTSFLHGQCVDLPLSEVMQMCGRAGRPGMDEHGVALILTTANKAHLYRACCGGGDGDGEGEGDAVLSTVVESHLHRHMIEHVNAEVSLGTIHSLHTAVMWAQTTFLWVRLGQHPQHYGLHFSSREEEQRFSPLAFVERLMRRVLGALVEERCIATIATDVPTQPHEKVWMEDEEGEEGAEVMPPSAPRTEDLLLPHTRLHPTRVGRCMARMYVLFATVHDLNQAVLAKCDGDGAPTNERQNQPPPPPPPPTTTTTSSSTTNTVEEGVAQPHRFQLRDALTLLSKCAELTEVRLRQGDRGPLNHINKSAKFALHSGRRGGREVREHWHKIFLLIQSLVAQQTVADISLRNDAMRVWAMVPRLARFLGEYARTTLSYSLILSTQMLQRCIDQRVWPDGLVLRQLHCVGEAAAKALDQGGFREVRRVRDVEACKMEALCGRPPPFGTLLLRELHALPTCRLDVVPSSATCHHVRLTAVPKHSTSAAAASCLGEEDGGDSGIHGRIRRGRFLLLVGHPRTDVLLLLRFIPVRRLMHDGNTFTSDADDVGVGVSFELTLPSSMSADEVGVHLLTPHFVGNDQSCSLRTAPECHVNHHVVGEHSSHGGGDVAAGATHHTEICGRATEEVAAEAAVEARQAFAELLHDFAYVEANHPRRRRRVAAGATHPRTPPSPSPAAQPTTSPLRDEVEVPCSPAATQDVPCITQEVMEERMMGMMMVPPMLCQSSENVHNTDVRDVEEVGVEEDPDDDDDDHDVMVLGMNPPWKRSRAEEKAEVSEEGAQRTTTTSLHVKPADFGTCLEWEPSTLPPLSFSIPAAAPTRAAARPGPTHPRPPQPSPEPQPLPWRMLGQTPYNNRTTHGGFSSRREAPTTANPAQFGAQIATTHHPLATQHPPRTVVAQMAHTSPQPRMPSFTTTATRNPYEPPPWLTHTYAAPPWMMMAPPPPPPPPREDVVWRRRSVPSWPYAHTTHATLQPWSQAQPAGPWGHAPPTSVPFSSSTHASHAAHPMSASYQHAPFTSAQQAAYSYFFHHHQHHHQHQPPTPW